MTLEPCEGGIKSLVLSSTVSSERWGGTECLSDDLALNSSSLDATSDSSVGVGSVKKLASRDRCSSEYALQCSLAIERS